MDEGVLKGGGFVKLRQKNWNMVTFMLQEVVVKVAIAIVAAMKVAAVEDVTNNLFR